MSPHGLKLPARFFRYGSSTKETAISDADLAEKEKITGNEVLDAIQFRSLGRRLFE